MAEAKQNESFNLRAVELAAKFRHGDSFALSSYAEAIREMTLKEVGEWLETQQLAEFFDVNDTSCVSFKKEVIEALKQGKMPC